MTQDVVAYPNPCTHAVTSPFLPLLEPIGFWSTPMANLSVLAHAQEKVLRIDTSDLPAGAYFVRGTDGNARWSSCGQQARLTPLNLSPTGRRTSYNRSLAFTAGAPVVDAEATKRKRAVNSRLNVCLKLLHSFCKTN